MKCVIIRFINRNFRVIPISPPKLLVPNSESISPVNTAIGKEDSLDRTILGMSSLDLATAIQSMNTMENVSINKLVNQTFYLQFQQKFIMIFST